MLRQGQRSLGANIRAFTSIGSQEDQDQHRRRSSDFEDPPNFAATQQVDFINTLSQSSKQAKGIFIKNQRKSQPPLDQALSKKNKQFGGSKVPSTPPKNFRQFTGTIKPFNKGDLPQSGALQNSGDCTSSKKQTSIHTMQRANVAKFKKSSPLFSLNSTKECTFCATAPPSVTFQHSCYLQHSHSYSRQRHGAIPAHELLMSSLGRKYANCHAEFENLKVVNDLIYNEQTHVVSVFKDYLIMDDINEFLKRGYKLQTEAAVRLPKLCDFYHKYSQVFPNFVVLPESKYMFRNIQRKQRLIDEQFNANQGKTPGADGQDHRRKPSLLHSSNRLFSTHFIESVMNAQLEEVDVEIPDLSVKKALEAKARYIESARKLDEMGRPEPSPFVQENLNELVTKFLQKDSESTMRLNTSLGQFGDEILGDTFMEKAKQSQITDSRKSEIGLVVRHSEQIARLSNRVSIISQGSQGQAKVASPPSKTLRRSGPSTVTCKSGPTKSLSKQSTAKKPKAGSSGSTRKAHALNSKPTSINPSAQSALIAQTLQKSATSVSQIKGARGFALASNSQLQTQLGTKTSEPRAGYASKSSLAAHARSTKAASDHAKQFAMTQEQKSLRNNYLECDLGEQPAAHKTTHRVDSGSNSPEAAITNPLSAQPLITETNLLQKTTQPGSSLGLKKLDRNIILQVHLDAQKPPQKGAESCKATSSQQRHTDSDYYSGGANLLYLRAQTALAATTNAHSRQPTQQQVSNPAAAAASRRQFSRERSPPMMTAHRQKKSKKEPHQKKDRRTTTPSDCHLLYQTGKSSVQSFKGGDRRISPQNQDHARKESKTSLGLASKGNAPSGTGPVLLSTQGSGQVDEQTGNVHPQNFYSHTEINEEYPEDEVADEIPDQDEELHADTEDEGDRLGSDDEAKTSLSTANNLVPREKMLRPFDLIPVQGRIAAQRQTALKTPDEDIYSLKQPGVPPSRPHTQLNLLPSSNENTLRSSKYQPGQSQGQCLPSANTAALNSAESLALQNPSLGPSAPAASDFNAALANERRRQVETNGVKTELEVRVQKSKLTLGAISFPPKVGSGCATTSHAVNRPHTNIMSRQSISIRSKFSRENSLGSRQDTQQTLAKPSLQDSQKFFDSSLKLGNLGMKSPQQPVVTLPSSLRNSIEPGQLLKNSMLKPASTTAVSKQASAATQPKTKLEANAQPKKPTAMNSKHTAQMDLNTRLATNLITDHLKRKTNTTRSTQKFPNKLQMVPQGQIGANKPAKAGGVVKSGRESKRTFSNTRTVPKLQSSLAAIGGASYQKQTPALMSQSPPAASASFLKRSQVNDTQEQSSMQANVRATYNSSFTGMRPQNNLSSRNFASPYASGTQMQQSHLAKKDSITSLPQAANFPRSPPAGSKGGVFQATLMKNPVQTQSLQQKLHYINKQLATHGQAGVSQSFKGTAIASPSHQSSQSVKHRFAAGNQNASPTQSTQEAHPKELVKDLEETQASAVTRKSPPKKQPQALISLPGRSVVAKTKTGSRASETGPKAAVANSTAKPLLSNMQADLKMQMKAKTGAFLGSRLTASQQMSTLAAGHAKTKKQSAESVGTSDQLLAKRSGKQLGAQSSTQVSSFKSPPGDAMQSRLGSKKLSNQGKSLAGNVVKGACRKSQANTLVKAVKPTSVSLSPPSVPKKAPHQVSQ